MSSCEVAMPIAAECKAAHFVMSDTRDSEGDNELASIPAIASALSTAGTLHQHRAAQAPALLQKPKVQV